MGGASTSGAEHIRVAIILWVPSTIGWRSLSEAEHLQMLSNLQSFSNMNEFHWNNSVKWISATCKIIASISLW